MQSDITDKYNKEFAELLLAVPLSNYFKREILAAHSNVVQSVLLEVQEAINEMKDSVNAKN